MRLVSLSKDKLVDGILSTGTDISPKPTQCNKSRLRPFSGGEILGRRSSSPNVPRIEAPNSLSTSGFVGTNPENATSVLPIMRARFCRRSIRLLTACRNVLIYRIKSRNDEHESD